MKPRRLLPAGASGFAPHLRFWSTIILAHTDDADRKKARILAIKDALDLLGEPGQHREIRAIRRDVGAVSEFGTDTHKLAEWAFKRDNQPKVFKGIYYVLNKFIRPNGSTGSTKSEHITRRVWVPIDVDPNKPPRQDNADAIEKGHARNVADKVFAQLIARRFRGLVLCDSGNGYHILIPVDIANDDQAGAAIKALFAQLEAVCAGDALAHIDQKLSDAPRVLKLPGTIGKKGEHSEHRPYRMAGIIASNEPITSDIRAGNSALLLAYKPQEKTGSPTLPQLGGRITSGNRPDAVTRAGLFVRAIPGAIQGQNGSDQLWDAAMSCVEDFALSPSEAMMVLLDNFNERCDPVWPTDQLEHTIANAVKKAGTGQKAIGWRLDQDKPQPQDKPRPASAKPMAWAAPPDDWPTPITDAAFIGPIGDFVQRVTIGSEANKSACLVACLVRFGNRIGRTAGLRVGGTVHYPNEFALLVGPTSSGRKGTTLSYAAHLFGQTDELKPDWNDPLIGRDQTGFSSGQGVIHALRDPAGDDAGVQEKRLLVSEQEFAKVLAGCRANESTLSAVIRDFWDSGNAAIMNKNSPTAATNAHLSILAAITPDELTTAATSTDIQNGFLNRFLIICCRRPGLFASPPPVLPSMFLPERQLLRQALGSRINRADQSIEFDDEAQNYWLNHAYAKLECTRFGAAESLLARASGHVLRLAIVYAVSEDSASITKRHLQAAMRVWDYAENSVKHLFGSSTGSKRADVILDELRAIPEGMTRLELHALTGRHATRTDLDKVRSKLLQAGLIRVVSEPTSGRPIERWFALRVAN